MKKTITLLSFFAAASLSAQVVGDSALGTYIFTNHGLPQGGNTSQYKPMVYCEDGERSVIWTQGISGDVGIFHTKLNTNYISNNQIDTVVKFTGILNSDGDAINLRSAYNATANKFAVIYRFSHNLTVVKKDFSIKAKTFSSSDFSQKELVIEGPFDFANERPFAHEIAAGPGNSFGVVYMSDGGNSTKSRILFKTFDAKTGTLSPAASAGVQTGLIVSNFGAKNPTLAWNEQEQVWGITYEWGKGKATKLVFVSLDVNGNLLTPEKDVVNNNAILTTNPMIKADGNSFVLIWRDYRGFKIPGKTSTSGTPAVRISQLTKTGDVISNSGTSPFFDTTDNSLIVSNPYLYGTYIYQDFLVVTPREKYGISWVTQDAPYAVLVTEAVVSTTGVMNSMVPVQVDDVKFTSDQVSMAYENGKYIVTYMEYNSQKYKNRIAVGTYQAGNKSSKDEVRK